MNTPYKLPKVCKNKDGDWYVEFSYEYPDQSGRFKRFKARGGINYIKNISEKEREAEELRANISYALTHLVYNPFAEEQKVEAEIIRKEKSIEIKKGRAGGGMIYSFFAI